ncbi:hypothetical protein V6N12_020224 [Hibiscus sabdariffa]|uniref:Uncharacterized protein n=1 Tax=Hibiscus sabdariffa TaxID=183260 RepID=A0ABR2BMP6_9ROSI
MSDLVVRMDKIEECYEQLVRTQKEVITHVKKFQEEMRGQMDELMSMMAAMTKDKSSMGNPLDECDNKTPDKNWGCGFMEDEIVPKEEQAFVNQYEVACTTSECPIELELDKIHDSLMKILSHPTKEKLDEVASQNEKDLEDTRMMELSITPTDGLPSQPTKIQPLGVSEPPPLSIPNTPNPPKKIKKTKDLQFSPIPFTYQEMFAQLLEAHLVTPYFVKLQLPPYPRWFKEGEHCEFHAGIQGHSIEGCISFKRRV